MNFMKFEVEILSFLNENFENLKKRKVSNSEMAFKDLLLTEHNDTNNAIRNIIKKLVSAARADFVNLTDEAKGYGLGEQFKALVIPPQLDMIKVEFNKNELKSSGTPIYKNQSSKSETSETFEKYREKSPINNAKKSNTAQTLAIVAVSTIAIGTPILTKLMKMGLGISLTIAGISAIVIGGVAYTLLSLQDKDGNIQQVKVQQPTPPPGVAKLKSAQSVKKTMDKVSVDMMLDIRKAEAELAVKNAIQKAEVEYNKIIAQLNS